MSRRGIQNNSIFANRISQRLIIVFLTGIGCTLISQSIGFSQLAIRGKKIFTMAGEPILNGVVIIEDGKISAVGAADEMDIPANSRILEAEIVTPGLIDGHATAGLTGIYNQPQDQDHHDKSSAMQPELRAKDAVNVQEALLSYLLEFGITTLHTGHSSGELIPGQTVIIKNVGGSIDDAQMIEVAAVQATLGPAGTRSEGSPGTRGKQMAMLRQEFIKAQEYLKKQALAMPTPADESKAADDATDSSQDSQSDSDNDRGKTNQDQEVKSDEKKQATPPDRDLRLESLGLVLQGKLPLMITANRAQEIASALRLAEEFKIRLWLDGAAESYLMIDEIRAAKIPVFIHPTMIRAAGDYENLSFETAAKLVAADIPVVMQSGYESYVPKTRVVLFEAALAASHGLTFEQALATITRDAAESLGIADRVGSIAVGKDADLALFDGDPFEYTTHCIGVIVNGDVVSEKKK